MINPMPQTVQPVSFLEYANQAASLKSQHLNQQAAQMRMDRMPQEYAMEDQLNQARMEEYQSKANSRNQDDGLKKHAALAKLAQDLVNKTEQQGITDPQQQDEFARKYQAVMRPYIQNVLGLPGDGDMSYEQVKMIAGSLDAEKDNYLLGYDEQGRPFRFSKNHGIGGPVPAEGGGFLEGSNKTPEYFRNKKAAEEGEKGVKVTNSKNQEYYTTLKNASGGQVGNVPTVEMDQTEHDALLMAAREDNPDVKMRDAARARIESMATGQPIMSPSSEQLNEQKINLAQGEADVKNEADLKKKAMDQRQKSLVGAQELEKTLNDMARYLFPNGEVTRDKTKRIIKPSEQMVLGNSLIDRGKSVAHDYGMDSKQASNLKAVQRLANKAVIDLMGGSLGSGISNADRDFFSSQIGIIEKAQHIDDIYNAVADIDNRIKSIRKGAVMPGSEGGKEAEAPDYEKMSVEELIKHAKEAK